MLNQNLTDREQAKLIEDLIKRGYTQEDASNIVAKLVFKNSERKRLIAEIEEFRAINNELSRKIGQAFKEKNLAVADELKASVKEIKELIPEKELILRDIEEEIKNIVFYLPNFLHIDVPFGLSESDNVELYRSKNYYKHIDIDHVDIGNKFGFRLEDGVRISGSRFSAYEGEIARLERAIGNFFLDIHVDEHGYTEVNVPIIVGKEAMIGTGQLPKFKDDMFSVNGMGRESYLIPTGEVPLTNLYGNKILLEEELPIKLVGLTPCFRAEAGAYGKDTRGLIRQHQFYKVELVQITTPDKAEEAHQEILTHARRLLDLLKLPYRIVLLCSGDISFSAHKCFDLEVWLPSQNKYREISSVSQFGDFQARRMKTTYRPKDNKRNLYVNTLNGSGLAIGRTLVAIMENYYFDDKIIIPEVLIPYMNGKKEITIKPTKRSD